MIRIPKSALSFGAVALVAGALTLSLPRAAHALAAALVQVSNTPAAPAITQNIGKAASQLVHLKCISQNSTTSASLTCFAVTPTESSPPALYSVPAGQNLVITTVDFSQQVGSVTSFSFLPSFNVFLFGGNGTPTNFWEVPGAQAFEQVSSSQFHYPDGIVLTTGVTPQLFINSNGVTPFQEVFVDMFGYLTIN